MARQKEEFLGGFAQILGGLSGLVNRLEELAEHAKSTGDGEILDKDGAVRGVYGFQVKVGLGRDGQRDVNVQPFGNVPRPASRPAPSKAEPAAPPAASVREPIVDVFEEEGAYVIVAEMPGVGPAEVTFRVEGDILTLTAATRTHRYEKEVLLPGPVEADRVVVGGANGVVELRCAR